MARVNKPSIVVPGNAHLQVQLEKLGVTGAKTIGQRTVDLSADKVRGGKPKVVEGDWADGTAGQNLANVLHELGITNDATGLGVPPVDVLGRESFTVYSSPTATTPSSADTVNWADIVAVGIPIPTGQTWFIAFCFEASFTNSGGAINGIRLVDNAAVTLISDTPTTTTTRERYALFTYRTYGAGTWTVTFQYRPTANTATARAPWFQLLIARLT